MNRIETGHNSEQIQYTSRAQRAQELINFARERIAQYRAGEISRLPKWQELREQFGYTSNTPFYTTLRKAGVLEEWREAKKRKKESRTHYDNSSIEQNISSVPRDSRGRVLWKLPGNTPEQNEQLGIQNVQGLFSEKFPKFDEDFPRREDGTIAEDKREEANKFILREIGSSKKFFKIFGYAISRRRAIPYFNGSYIVAAQKSFSPWGLTIPREEFALRGHGRRGLTEAESREDLIPSRDLSWILGVLAGGGYSNPDDKRISIDSNNEKFLDEFKTVGERVFKVNGGYRTRVKADGEREYKGVTFHSRKIALMLGDLRSQEWPTTIINQHKWILENSNYLWSFIEGVFERKGGINMSKNRIKGIAIYTDSISVANFVMELLVRLGIQNPVIEYNKRGQEGIKGIRLSNIQDMRHFAENIHSRIPEKENRLSACRELRRYERRSLTIGDTTVKGQGAVTEDMHADISSILKQYEREKGVQVKYVPKLHRESEEEGKNKLEEIIMGTKELPEPQVLFGPDGESPVFPQSIVEDHIQAIAESKLEDKPEHGTELYVATKSGQEKLLEVLPKGSKRSWTPEEVRRKAVEFYNVFGRLSTKTLRKHKQWDFLSAISRCYQGEMKQLKVDLGLESPTTMGQESKQLSIEQIEGEALKIYETEGKLTKDVLERLGRNDLIWAIRKHYPGRYKGLRDKLGLQGPLTNQRVDKKPSGYWNVEQIEKEAQEFYLKSGKLSHRSFKRANRQDLLRAIRTHYPGGLSALKEKLGAIDEKPRTQATQIFP